MTGRLRALYLGVILALLAAPIVIVAGVSVNGAQSLRFPPQNPSLRWYGELLRQSDWMGQLANSVTIAALASLLATAIALPLALFVWARGGWAGRALYALGAAPFVLPPVVTALGFLTFWVSVGLYGAMTATVVSHAVFLVTLPVATISLGLGAVNRELVEASRVMGASRTQALATVVLPLIRPYVVSGYAFAFVLSLNEYIIAYMVAGFTVETLPIKIFNSLRYGYTPVMGVASVLFVAVAAVVFGLVGRFGDLPRLLGAERAGER
jgi:putative spermidine/putrescine transport system permease protein